MSRLRLFLLLVVGAAMLVPAAEASHQSARVSPLLRLVPQLAGRANFGFTFRLFDTTDPLWGDTRPFDERIRDSIQTELAGKTPTFIKV